MATCIMRLIHCTRYCYQVSWVLSHFSPTVLLYLVQYYTTWLLHPSTYYGTWYSSVLISEVPTYLVDPTSTLFPYYTCTISSVHFTGLPHTWYRHTLGSMYLVDPMINRETTTYSTMIVLYLVGPTVLFSFLHYPRAYLVNPLGPVITTRSTLFPFYTWYLR